MSKSVFLTVRCEVSHSHASPKFATKFPMYWYHTMPEVQYSLPLFNFSFKEKIANLSHS